MKTNMIFVCLVLFFLSASAQKKKKSNKPKVPSSYFITNWAEYRMPEEIETDKLKKILENIAAFKRLEYCPLGKPKRCEKATIKTIVQKIVEDVLENREHVDYEDSDEKLFEVQQLYTHQDNAGIQEVEHTVDAVENGDEADGENGGDHQHLEGGGENAENAEDGTNPQEGDGGDAGGVEGENPEGGDNPEEVAEGAENAEGADVENPPEDAAALRVSDKLHSRSDINTDVIERKYASGNMVNFIKMVNLGTNVQHFTDNKGLSDEGKHKTDDQYLLRMLKLFENIVNVKKTKRN